MLDKLERSLMLLSSLSVQIHYASQETYDPESSSRPHSQSVCFHITAIALSQYLQSQHLLIHSSYMCIPPTHRNYQLNRRIAKHSAFLWHTSIWRHVIVGEGVAVPVEVCGVDYAGVVLYFIISASAVRREEHGSVLTFVIGFW